MKTSLLASLALALAAAGAADAQPGRQAPMAEPPMAQPESAAPATSDNVPPAQPGAPATSGLKVGMPVVDNTGAPLGPIDQLTILQGQQVAIFTVEGKQAAIPVDRLTLSPSSDKAVLSANKAQLLAALGGGH